MVKLQFIFTTFDWKQQQTCCRRIRIELIISSPHPQVMMIDVMTANKDKINPFAQI